MSNKTQNLSVHRTRFKARSQERKITLLINLLENHDADPFTGEVEKTLRRELGVPVWAKGVRVEKIGRFQFAVVATSWKGH